MLADSCTKGYQLSGKNCSSHKNFSPMLVSNRFLAFSPERKGDASASFLHAKRIKNNCIVCYAHIESMLLLYIGRLKQMHQDICKMGQ